MFLPATPNALLPFPEQYETLHFILGLATTYKFDKYTLEHKHSAGKLKYLYVSIKLVNKYFHLW